MSGSSAIVLNHSQQVPFCDSASETVTSLQTRGLTSASCQRDGPGANRHRKTWRATAQVKRSTVQRPIQKHRPAQLYGLLWESGAPTERTRGLITGGRHRDIRGGQPWVVRMACEDGELEDLCARSRGARALDRWNNH